MWLSCLWGLISVVTVALPPPYGAQATFTSLIILMHVLISTADLSLVYDLLPRYGDMRKEIGFRIRDMWYNLGECMTLNMPTHNSRLIASRDGFFSIVTAGNADIYLSGCLEAKVDLSVFDYNIHVIRKRCLVTHF